MKKFIVLLFVVSAIIMTGCGNDNVSKLDIKNTENIIEKDLKNMKEVDDSSLEDVYDLDLSKMDEHVIKQNEDGDLYAIIKTSDKTSVKNVMEKYFEKVQQFNKNYSPERLEILDSRLEKEIGDYLIYIVSKDASKIYDKIVKSL